MKVLSIKQSVEEFNKDLKEGIEHGFILSNIKDNRILIELCANLFYYLQYFISAYAKEKS